MPTPKLLNVAIVILAASLSPAAFAQGETVTTTLELPLSGNPPQSAPSRTTGRSALSSRGGPMFRRSDPKPVVLGKLAIVTSGRAMLRAGRETEARLLSVVNQGSYLAIVSEVGDHYGVLMIDRSTGWIPKSAVRMVDYQVAVGNPDDAAPPTSPESGSGGVPDLPEGLDGRTIALLREAFSYLGVPYVWAGNTRSGLDCSAFVKNVFSSQGISLPRHSGDQAKVGARVNWQDLRAGDRLYFDMGNKGRVSHCGIYLGNGYFIHASSNQKQVGVDSLMKPNYYKALVDARRS